MNVYAYTPPAAAAVRPPREPRILVLRLVLAWLAAARSHASHLLDRASNAARRWQDERLVIGRGCWWCSPAGVRIPAEVHAPGEACPRERHLTGFCANCNDRRRLNLFGNCDYCKSTSITDRHFEEGGDALS